MLFVWWGLVFLFFVAPFSLLAVFIRASEFNSDVSNWNTGAVTNMFGSKCTLSLPLCGHASAVVLCFVSIHVLVLHVQQPEFYRITILTRFVLFVL